MSQTIIRVFEGDPLPMHATNPQILAVENVQYGTGGNTRILYTITVTDNRFWLADNQKRAEPLGASTAPTFWCGASTLTKCPAQCGRCAYESERNK